MKEWLKDKLIVNWKTTGVGLVGFLATSILANTSHFHPAIVTIAQFVAMTSVFGLGVVSEDKSIK